MNLLGRWFRAELLHVAALFAVLAAGAHWLVMQDPVAELAMRSRWVEVTGRVRGAFALGSPSSRDHREAPARPELTAGPAPRPRATPQVQVRQQEKVRAPQSKPAHVPDQHQPIAAGYAQWLEVGLGHYWRYDYAAAQAALHEAARQDASDCTAWYFIALSQYLSGSPRAATASLAKAVELEGRHSPSILGRLLQRVQGAHRAWLETARINAGVGPYRRRFNSGRDSVKAAK